jgi:Leucine-rich repeat (LRR) protein
MQTGILSGSLPSGIGALTALKKVAIHDTALNGILPKEIGLLTNCDAFLLSNTDISGPIPSDIGLMAALMTFDVRGSSLTGPLPSELGLLESIEAFLISNTAVSGPLPDETFWSLPNLRRFEAADCGLSETIPPSVGLASNLDTLQLNGNDFGGPVPSELGLLGALRQLSLAGNRISGRLPSELGQLTSLLEFYGHDNAFTGDIPFEYGNWYDLTVATFDKTDLSGSMPQTICNLDNKLLYADCQSVVCPCCDYCCDATTCSWAGLGNDPGKADRVMAVSSGMNVPPLKPLPTGAD